MSPRKALRAHLKRNKLSMAKFAASVGVSRPAISVLLSDDDREPTLSLALNIERQTGGAVKASAWARDLRG